MLPNWISILCFARYYPCREREGIGEQEITDLVAAVIEDEAAPVRVKTFPRIGMLIEAGAVEVVAQAPHLLEVDEVHVLGDLLDAHVGDAGQDGWAGRSGKGLPDDRVEVRRARFVEIPLLTTVEVEDFGTQGPASVDYPDIGRKVSLCIAGGEAEWGILVCTSGIGMSISANKFPGIRAALVQDLDAARSSREHNDANILALPGRFITVEEAYEIVDAFLSTPFEGGRHLNRINKMPVNSCN